jgi:two-component system LytT family sensor kinase
MSRALASSHLESVSNETLGRWVRQLAIYTAIWTVPVVLGVAGHYFGQMVEGPGMPTSHVVGHSIALWYVWVLATPVIFGIHRRRFPVPAMVASHALTLAALFFAQTWLSVVIGHMTGHVSPTLGWEHMLSMAVVNLLLYDMLIYGAVIAVAVGLEINRRYRERDLRASQLETQLGRARLETLQTQLQPHFLFNALNAIAMLVRRDRKNEAVDTIVGFSELLRYVLDEAGTMDVTLEEELGFVRRYLDIEKVRLGERLKSHIEVDAGAGRALVPNLMLQPLVENAIKHAIAVRPEGGTIWITVKKETTSLRIDIADDGPGLTRDFDPARSQGLGLRNLRERLAMVYGDAGRIQIAPRDGGGTVVHVEIPFGTAPAGHPESHTRHLERSEGSAVRTAAS